MLELIIGNKNYSSWSMRPWFLLTHADIPFQERFISFNAPAWKAQVAAISPAARVPVLKDDELIIWDTLAICEYLADKFPEKSLWPKDAKARAVARSACAEMHSGFGNLRGACPMNLTARLPGRGWNLEVQADVDRLCALWAQCRLFASGGPFLFGEFSIADAYFAPVVSRFVTYEPELTDDARDYLHTMTHTDTWRTWEKEALAENEFVQWDEPYRKAP